VSVSEHEIRGLRAARRDCARVRRGHAARAPARALRNGDVVQCAGAALRA
jgi:hypothetical protein